MNLTLKTRYGVILFIFIFFISVRTQETFAVVSGESFTKSDLINTKDSSLDDTPPNAPTVYAQSIKECYNSPFTLSLTPHSTGALYEWQFGEDILVPVIEPRFRSVFINNIVSRLFQASANSNILNAVSNTNYYFMVENLFLYDNMPARKLDVAYELMQGIIISNTTLTTTEISFLYNNFITIVLAETDCPPPYNLVPGVGNWKFFATAKSESEAASFIPKDNLAELQYTTKIYFRARAYTNLPVISYSPWSPEVAVDILPGPPTAIVNSDIYSCMNRPTGEITISVVTSPYNTNLFTYMITDGTCEDWGSNTVDFTGTTKVVENKVRPGIYSLCLSYTDPSVKGCIFEKTFSVHPLPVLNFSITKSDVSCPGGNDGEITVNLLLWAKSFSITANGSTVTLQPYTFSGLAKSNYGVIVNDYCISDNSKSMQIDEPPLVVIDNVAPRSPTCTTNPNGGFEISVSGALTGKYDYRILNSLGVVVYSAEDIGSVWSYYSLPGGSYTINVRDYAHPACAGVSTGLLVLRPATPLGLKTTGITDVKCFGESNGEIKVTASGGTGSYNINIGSTVIIGDQATFSSLLAGNYTAYVHNNNKTCSDAASVAFIIGTNPQIDISLIPADVKCFSDEDGKINAVVSGGTNIFQSFDWEKIEGTDWQSIKFSYNNDPLVNLSPGNYRIKVTDSKDCFEYKEATINEPAPFTITSIVPRDVVCFGDKGSIHINASGGNGGYSFSWYENGGISYENLPADSPLPAGTYVLKVTDSKACEARWEEEGADKEVIITEPSVSLDFTTVLSDYNGFNISCNGNSNGSISVNASGGNEYGYNGYTYSLSGWTDQTNGLFTNLTAGTYNIKVTDGRECISSKAVTLKEPDPLLLSVNSIDQVKCFGAATGKIIVEAKGGTEPSYKYQLDETVPVISGVFSNLYAGTYKIQAVDLNGCKQELFATVTHKSPLVETIVVPQDVRCFGENNGEIAASVSGGSGGFGLHWEKMINGSWQTTGETVANPDQLGPGNYRLKVTDSDNCSVKDSTTVKEPDLLSITKVDLHDIICYGETGSIDIPTHGGNPGYKYFYSENNGTTYTEFTSLSPLTAATYKLKVSDSKGCETIWPENLSITRPPESLGLTYIAKDYNGYSISCFGNNNGLITVTPSGGNGAAYQGYSYLISGRASRTLNMFDSLTSGSYDISVTDARGCRVTKHTVLTQPAAEIFLWASSLEQANCIDDANGRITLAASGGRSPYTYSLTDNAFVSGNEFMGLKVGDYHFRAKDLNGCVQTFDTSIVNTVPKMEITGTISDAKCYGQSSGAIRVNISGGAVPFSYHWKDNSSVDANIDNLFKGKYELFVTDSAGCKAGQIFEIQEPLLPLSVTAVSQSACVLTPNGTIIPAAIGGTPPYLFAVDNQSRMYNNSLFLIYSGRHKVFAADANNCRAETEITVNERNTMPFVNFMLATSRYERDTLVVIDVSVPKPNNVTWGFSPEAMVIATNPFDAKIKYNVTGIYPVRMTGHFETCDYSVEKLLNIAPYDPLVTVKDKYLTGIESVKITPNPNDGQFKVKVKLYTKQQIHIKILDYYSKIWHSSRYPAGIEFEQDINISGVLPGTYVLWIVSDNDSKALLFVISQ